MKIDKFSSKGEENAVTNELASDFVITPITHCSNPGTFLTTNIEAKLSSGKNELPHDINALQMDTFIRRMRGVNDVFVSPCQRTAEGSFGCVVFTSQVLQLILYFRNSRVILQYINMMLSKRLILKQMYKTEAIREATAGVCRLIDLLNNEPLMTTIHSLTRQLCSHLCSSIMHPN